MRYTNPRFTYLLNTYLLTYVYMTVLTFCFKLCFMEGYDIIAYEV